MTSDETIADRVLKVNQLITKGDRLRVNKQADGNGQSISLNSVAPTPAVPLFQRINELSEQMAELNAKIDALMQMMGDRTDKSS